MSGFCGISFWFFWGVCFCVGLFVFFWNFRWFFVAFLLLFLACLRQKDEIGFVCLIQLRCLYAS